MPKPFKMVIDESEEELLQMSRDEIAMNLTEREMAFAEFYIGNYNPKMAAIKAGYSPKAANTIGWNLRRKPEVQRYIAWMKIRVGTEMHVRAIDVLDMYVRLAFSDVTDYIEVKDGKRGSKTVEVKDLDMLDGQMIKRITQNVRGDFTVELFDKMDALSKLEQYFDIMPKDWKQRIEERKLELAEEKLEIEKVRIGLVEELVHDDGFIAALIDTGKSVWDSNVKFQEKKQDIGTKAPDGLLETDE